MEIIDLLFRLFVTLSFSLILNRTLRALYSNDFYEHERKKLNRLEGFYKEHTTLVRYILSILFVVVLFFLVYNVKYIYITWLDKFY